MLCCDFRIDITKEDFDLKNNAYLGGFRKAVNENIKKMTLCVKITACALAFLMVVLAVALFVDILGMKIEYTLEAGEELPSAAKLSGRAGAEYDFGDEDGEFNVPGEYTIYIVDGGRRFRVLLTVEDTTAPRARLLELCVNQTGPYPAAIDFFADVEDASEVKAKFKNSVSASELGEYEVLLELSDSLGNSKNYKTKMTVIVDTQAPTFNGPATASVSGYLGEGIAYRKVVEAVDNCFGEVSVEVDSSEVKLDVAGSYRVYYKATDKAGNSSTYELTVNILAEKITREMVMNEIGKLASQLGINKNMSKEEQVKRIFKYVNSPALSGAEANVKFTDESNTDRSDWIREAYYTMQRGSGDCYSYFALSKAFFEYFGIENLDIQRSAGVTTQSGTHFWNMVNIGTESAPRWYYYDATRLKVPHRTGSGCLFTEAQLEDYNTKVKVGFLTFDHAGYPEASNTTINTEYSWR